MTGTNLFLPTAHICSNISWCGQADHCSGADSLPWTDSLWANMKAVFRESLPIPGRSPGPADLSLQLLESSPPRGEAGGWGQGMSALSATMSQP